MIDIIVPTYKNKQSLRNTLSSINQALLSNFIITVVDDCSNIDYTDIKMQFPFVTLYILQKNVGPGMARQFGIEHTQSSYILFIDTGDIFISQQSQQEIITIINQHPEVQIFSWAHKCENTGLISQDRHNRLHGRIYKRSFLQKHNIKFSQEGSRVNEDIGFNRTCRLILKQYYPQTSYYYFQIPIILWHQGPESITQKNNYSFTYKESTLGLAINEQNVFRICQQNNISNKNLQIQADEIIIAMYKKLCLTILNRPEYIQNVWNGAYRFYHNIYYKYENTPSFHRQNMFSKMIKQLHNKAIPLNFNRFLFYLKENKNIPAYYLTFTQNHDIINK